MIFIFCLKGISIYTKFAEVPPIFSITPLLIPVNLLICLIDKPCFLNSFIHSSFRVISRSCNSDILLHPVSRQQNRPLVLEPSPCLTVLCGKPPSCSHLTLSSHKKSTDFISTLFGGRGWIRTTEAISSRFTVCPLWPLGNSPTLYGTSELVPLGAGDGTRPRNLLITNQLLCQLSYTSILSFYGGSYRARTCDPLLVRQMLSQLS